VLSFREAEYGTDHYLVVAKVRKNWQYVRKQHEEIGVDRFHLRKLSELPG
jgi:hypothetical protein